jgi:hypothetical protein
MTSEFEPGECTHRTVVAYQVAEGDPLAGTPDAFLGLWGLRRAVRAPPPPRVGVRQ